MIVRLNLETNLVLQQLQQDPLSTMKEQVWPSSKEQDPLSTMIVMNEGRIYVDLPSYVPTVAIESPHYHGAWP